MHILYDTLLTVTVGDSNPGENMHFNTHNREGNICVGKGDSIIYFFCLHPCLHIPKTVHRNIAQLRGIAYTSM